jgi:SAM-dependent methyltransferase
MTRNTTSTGHEASNAGWLDLHFESSRPEYESALREVGIGPGWAVLDTGCGSGGFLPYIAELVGEAGSLSAVDLAPENVDMARALLASTAPGRIADVRVADVLSLPFADAAFDCVWSANVMQYLTPAAFRQAADEAGRVLKPGGLFAVKDFDSTSLQIRPIDYGIFTRFMAARMETFRRKGVLGTDCGSRLPALLAQAGWQVLRRRGWMVERWPPVDVSTRNYLRDLLAYFASVAPDYELPADDRRYWRDLADAPDRLLDRSDFCYREFFVVTVCKRP